MLCANLNSHVACRFLHYYWMWRSLIFFFFCFFGFFLVFNSDISNVVIVKFTFYFSFLIVVEWGDDVKAVSEDEAVVLVNHQATGDVCTLMMCLQDKGTVGYNWGAG